MPYLYSTEFELNIRNKFIKLCLFLLKYYFKDAHPVNKHFEVDIRDGNLDGEPPCTGKTCLKFRFGRGHHETDEGFIHKFYKNLLKNCACNISWKDIAYIDTSWFVLEFLIYVDTGLYDNLEEEFHRTTHEIRHRWSASIYSYKYARYYLQNILKLMAKANINCVALWLPEAMTEYNSTRSFNQRPYRYYGSGDYKIELPLNPDTSDYDDVFPFSSFSWYRFNPDAQHYAKIIETALASIVMALSEDESFNFDRKDLEGYQWYDVFRI